MQAGRACSDWVYTLQLRLEDATGELDVLLFDKDGAEFFQVTQPSVMGHEQLA